MVACSSVADNPTGTVPPATHIPDSVREATTTAQGDVSSGVSQFSDAPPAPIINTPTEQLVSVHDDRVEGLVTEWENDLTPIRRLSECVEQALGLDRPLLPEDLQLQANQPAIVNCLRAEVADE